MSIDLTIPASASPILTATTFTAAWNVPTPARYDWGIAANQDVPILTLKTGSVYIIERACFSMDIAEGDFQAAINTIPRIVLLKRSNQNAIFPTPQPFINYIDNLEELFFFSTSIEGEILTGNFTGLLNGTPALVGDASITANVQFLIYEVTDTKWAAEYLFPKMNLGDDLRFRGRAIRPGGY